MPRLTSRPLVVSLTAVAVIEVVVGAALVVDRRGDAPRRESRPESTVQPACQPGPPGRVPSASSTRPWTPGTVGERAGFAPGSSLFGESDAELQRDLKAMAALGVRWIRLDIDWSYIGRSRTSLRWCEADRVVVAARRMGFDVIALPAYTPAWARPGNTTDKHPPTRVEDFAAFVADAARRYVPLGVKTWEIWNEPNISQFWEPRPNAKEYAALLQAAASALRQVSLDVTILTAGTSPARDRSDGKSIAPATFLRGIYAAGAQFAFDAVATHPYSYPARPLDDSTDDWNAFVRLPELRRVMAEYGDLGKYVWLTEYGAPTGGGSAAVNGTEQAAMAEEAYGARARFPWLGPILWYSYRDRTGGGGVEDHFGLVDRRSRPKPAVEVFRLLMGRPLPTKADAGGAG